MATALLFTVYTVGIGDNPPGFYVDESGLAYNAYLVSTTGAGEFGPRFPLFFKLYTGGFTQYSNPTQIYLLALVFKLFGPGILTARVLAAASVFGACLLFGGLAARISGKRVIGIIVCSFALLTPWLFEIGRLVLETFFYPMAVVLFLWAVYRVQKRDEWSWPGCAAVAVTLTLLTYSYTIGRMLGPLLALSLICFAVNRSGLLSVLKTWLLYGSTLIPLAVFIRQNPDITTRFYLVSYIKPESSIYEIVVRFVVNYLADINPIPMLVRGDINQRHHMPDALGSFFAAAFVLAVIGLIVILVRHRGDTWWRFVLFGTAVTLVPAALTLDRLHTARMIAYPIFLLMLMVPALKWMLEGKATEDSDGDTESDRMFVKTTFLDKILSITARRKILAVLLVVAAAEASYFHWKYYQEGDKRGYMFDAAYKTVYDEAVARPNRPIYLVDAYWGPAYIHSLWYATLEGRDTGEFIHQPYGVRPPAGALVISTEQNCTNCSLIRRSGDYLLYITSNSPALINPGPISPAIR